MKIKVRPPRPCPTCKVEHIVMAEHEGVRRWEAGRPIQVALPDLTAEQREMIMTGFCDKHWNSIFDSEENANGSR